MMSGHPVEAKNKVEYRTPFQFTRQLLDLLARDIGPEIINSISQPISFILRNSRYIQYNIFTSIYIVVPSIIFASYDIRRRMYSR